MMSNSVQSVLWVVDAKSRNGSGAGFLAGLEVCVNEPSGRVRRAAPIVGYMTGWPGGKVRDYVARRGWKLIEYE